MSSYVKSKKTMANGINEMIKKVKVGDWIFFTKYKDQHANIIKNKKKKRQIFLVFKHHKLCKDIFD